MKVFGGAKHPSSPTVSHSHMPAEYHDMAFHYALSQPQVSGAMIGMATHGELEQNLRRARTFLPLSAGEAKRPASRRCGLGRQWSNHFGPVV
jgi:uncharacterized protein